MNDRLFELLRQVDEFRASMPTAHDTVVRSPFCRRTVERAWREDSMFCGLELHPDLIADAFAFFWEPKPRLRAVEELDLRVYRHRQVMECLFIHEHNIPAYDAYAAGVATAVIAPILASWLKSAGPCPVNALEEAEAKALEDLDPTAGDHLAVMLSIAQDYRQGRHQDVNTTAVDAFMATLTLDQLGEQLAADARTAGLWGLGVEELRKLPMAERWTLAKRLRSKKLQAIVDVLGRDIDLVRGRPRARRAGCGEFVEVDRTGDPSRAFPAEQARLCSPAPTVRLLALQDMAQGQLRAPVVDSPQPSAGPFVILVDSSYSMNVKHQDGLTRATWAKGTALALHGLAGDRDVTVVLFSGRTSWAPGDEPFPTWHFPAGATKPMDLMDFADSEIGGGTDVCTAMNYVMGTCDLTNADVVVISDGESGCSERWLARYREAKAERNFRTVGVLAGIATDHVLTKICDEVHAVTDLQARTPAATARSLRHR